MDKKDIEQGAQKVNKELKDNLDPEKLKEMASTIGDQLQNVGEVGAKITSGLQETGQVVGNAAGQAIEITGNIVGQGGDLLDAGERKLEQLQDQLSSIESDIESKFEDIEEEIRHHSKHIRFFIALFFFPIWFSFYNMIHTTLATWDIFVAVYRKIEKTRMKIIYTLMMGCVGCGVMQLILLVVSFFHVNCDKFKQAQSLQVAFRELAYEEKCQTAMKMEQSLMVFFGHYKPIDEKDMDMIELKEMPTKFDLNKSKTFTEKKETLLQTLLKKPKQ